MRLFRNIALWLIIIFTLLCPFVGIATLFHGGGDFGTLTLILMIYGSGAMFINLMALTGITAIDKKTWPWVGMAVVIFNLFAELLFILLAAGTLRYGIFERVLGSPEYWFQAFFTATTLGTWLAAAPILVRPRLKGFYNIFPWLTMLSLVAAGLLLLGYNFKINFLIEWSPFGNIFWTAAICTFSFGLITLIVGRYFNKRKSAPGVVTDTRIALTCPRCQKSQTLPTGHSVCTSCNLKFKIETEEPLCPTCGYNLHNLPTPICPECGTNCSTPTVRTPQKI